MVYQKISDDRKERALYLLLEREWDIERIADALGVSSKSIERWEEDYEVHGCVNPPKLIIGRPRLLSRLASNNCLTRIPVSSLTRLGNG